MNSIYQRKLKREFVGRSSKIRGVSDTFVAKSRGLNMAISGNSIASERVDLAFQLATNSTKKIPASSFILTQ